MEIILKSTTKMVEFDVNGTIVPARVWEGTTANGVPCFAFITRIGVSVDEDQSQFEQELGEATHRVPSPALQAIDMRYIL